MSKKNLMTVLRENRTLFTVIAVGLFLIELEIFILAAMKSGNKSVIQVLNASGEVIYASDGKNLSQFDKYYFEQNFGPLADYQLRLHTVDVPFPFRAWFVAAFGLPIGGLLLFAFVVRVYLAVFYGDRLHSEDATHAANAADASRFERFVLRVSRYNIFVIGFMALMGIAAFWVVPNVIVYLGRVGLDTLIRFRWAFTAAAVVGLALLIWVIYLRYLLARKAIESRTEVEKRRLELEYAQAQERRQLEAPASPPIAIAASDRSDAPPAGADTTIENHARYSR
jgi:hypothetical protein